MNSTLTVYDYEGDRGALNPRQTVSTIPEGFRGQNACAHVAVSPDGRFVYGSNRGHDSIAIYSVNEGSGNVTLTGMESTLGKEPRHFSLDPSGSWLIAANQRSDSIVAFRRDRKTGALMATEQPTGTPTPVAIVFSED